MKINNKYIIKKYLVNRSRIYTALFLMALTYGQIVFITSIPNFLYKKFEEKFTVDQIIKIIDGGTKSINNLSDEDKKRLKKSLKELQKQSQLIFPENCN